MAGPGSCDHPQVSDEEIARIFERWLAEYPVDPECVVGLASQKLLILALKRANFTPDNFVIGLQNMSARIIETLYPDGFPLGDNLGFNPMITILFEKEEFPPKTGPIGVVH